LQDVLQTYGIGRPAAESVAVSPAATIRSRNLLFRVAAVLAGVALLAAILTYHFNSVRADRAQAFRRAGEESAAGGDYAEAVQQFRNALSISHSAADRQALGLALVASGAPSEAVIYLNDVLRADPNNGAANLGMARVYARQGRVDESAVYYRRAANGSWPRDAAEHRLESRLELVDVLSKAGKNSNAQAELLSVVADAPKDLKVRRQLANQLVSLGLQRESVVLFREIVQRNPADGEAWAALGEAEFALADYPAAQEAFEKAAQFGAGDAVKEHSAIAERILALDPTPRGLNRRARYDRSVQLLQEVLNSVQSCGPGTAQAPEVAEEIRQAQASTGRKRRPSSYVDETDTNLDLAERIWTHRAAQCSAMPDDALARVMSKLHRE
jgi:tetratricopeptide (TPR) repeat protein